MEFVALLTRIQANLTALHVRQSAQVCYFLNVPKPYAQVEINGQTYRILQDGTTLASVAGVWLPMSGCPYPEAIWKLGTAVFWMRYRRFIPVAVAALVALASLQFLIATIPGAPGAAWFVDWFAAAMNAALVALASICLIAATLHNFRRGIVVQFGQSDTAGLLEAGQSDISPDMLILSVSETETGQDFWQRVRDKALDQLPAGQYIVVLQFRCADGVLVREPDIAGQSQVLFDRANLTKDLSGWYDEVTSPRRFDLETWADYCAYVRAFCEQFRVWSQRDKARQGNPLKNMADAAFAGAKAAVLALLLFCSFGVSAQSAVPVPERATDKVFGGNSILSNLPDSATFEQRKAAFMLDRRNEWIKVKPALDFYMWRFEASFLIIFLGIGGIFWIFAKVAARDSVKDIYGAPLWGDILTRVHLWCKGSLFLILMAISLAYLSEAVIRYYYTGGMPSLGTLVKWAVVCWLWYRVIEFVLPDTPGSKPEMGRLGGGNGFPRIG